MAWSNRGCLYVPKVSPPTQFRGVTEYSIGEDGICKAQQRPVERRVGQCSIRPTSGKMPAPTPWLHIAVTVVSAHKVSECDQDAPRRQHGVRRHPTSATTQPCAQHKRNSACRYQTHALYLAALMAQSDSTCSPLTKISRI